MHSQCVYIWGCNDTGSSAEHAVVCRDSSLLVKLSGLSGTLETLTFRFSNCTSTFEMKLAIMCIALCWTAPCKILSQPLQQSLFGFPSCYCWHHLCSSLVTHTNCLRLQYANGIVLPFSSAKQGTMFWNSEKLIATAQLWIYTMPPKQHSTDVQWITHTLPRVLFDYGLDPDALWNIEKVHRWLTCKLRSICGDMFWTPLCVWSHN